MTYSVDLLLLGCGNMGAALAGGFMKQNHGARVVAVDPQTERAANLLSGATGVDIVPTLNGTADTIPKAAVIALKPQAIAETLPDLAAHPAGSGLAISIAAGVTIKTVKEALPAARIVRAMPNTPALVGKGVTVLVAGPGATKADREFCELLFRAVGTIHWIDDESLMDRVTAVSGSGPAYIFAAVEAFVEAARKIGLDDRLSNSLVTETLDGAMAMILESDRPIADLKNAVRSPAGTTDAALRVFEHSDALNRLFEDAVFAACQRARDLGTQ